MLLGLQISGIAERYRDDSAQRGGPMMVVVAPTLPPPGLSAACSTYGASVLVLPDSSLDSVRVDASLCTQGEINAAVLYATVSVVGTHAALWTAAAEDLSSRRAPRDRAGPDRMGNWDQRRRTVGRRARHGIA